MDSKILGRRQFRHVTILQDYPDFNIASYSHTNQIILQALKTYGMMLADNGSAWFISGAPDARWDNTDLHSLT